MSAALKKSAALEERLSAWRSAALDECYA